MLPLWSTDEDQFGVGQSTHTADLHGAQEIQALRPRTMFVDRVVRPIVNAVYSRGNHVQRLLPLFVAEMARRDKFAACLAGPSIYDHRWELGCSGTD